MRFTGASHEENDRQPRDRAVDRRVAALYGAKAERDALERNRAGDYAAARKILERCIDRIRRYAGDDPEILAVAEDLRGKVARYGDDMDGLTRKTLHTMSSRSLKERFMEKERRRRRPPAKVSLLASHRLAGLLDPVIAHLAAADPDLFGDLALDVVNVPWADGAPLDPAEEAQVLDDVLAGAPPAAVRILFTTRRLSDNWFSHWHGSRGAAIVSLDGWDGSFGVPAEAFVAYEVIHHGLRLSWGRPGSRSGSPTRRPAAASSTSAPTAPTSTSSSRPPTSAPRATPPSPPRACPWAGSSTWPRWCEPWPSPRGSSTEAEYNPLGARNLMTLADRITLAPDVMQGKPVIRGTRITVDLILRKLAEGASEADILDAYPTDARMSGRPRVRRDTVLTRRSCSRERRGRAGS